MVLALSLLCVNAHASRVHTLGESPIGNSVARDAIMDKIKRIIASSGTVTLTVVPAQASADWERGWSRDLAEAEHNTVLSLLWTFEDYPEFILVERQRIDGILAEMRLSYTGLLAQRQEPANFDGVNYLLFVSELGYDNFKEYTYKLVELKSARIVAAAVDIKPYD